MVNLTPAVIALKAIDAGSAAEPSAYGLACHRGDQAKCNLAINCLRLKGLGLFPQAQAEAPRRTR